MLWYPPSPDTSAQTSSAIRIMGATHSRGLPSGLRRFLSPCLEPPLSPFFSGRLFGRFCPV